MSRRWLLSLFCLAVPLLLFVQLTRAHGGLRVNEGNTTVLFQKEPAEVRLAIENYADQLNSRIQVALLDPRNRIVVRGELIAAIARGNQTLVLSLPLSVSRLAAQERSQLGSTQRPRRRCYTITTIPTRGWWWRRCGLRSDERWRFASVSDGMSKVNRL